MIQTWTLTCSFFICSDSPDLIYCLHCYDVNDPGSGGTVMVSQWGNKLPNCRLSNALDDLSLNSSTARSPASLMMSNDVKPSKTHWTCWWVWSWGDLSRCIAVVLFWPTDSAHQLSNYHQPRYLKMMCKKRTCVKNHQCRKQRVARGNASALPFLSPLQLSAHSSSGTYCLYVYSHNMADLEKKNNPAQG